MENIPYSKQSIDTADIESVVEALHARLITQGPKTAEFEDAFAEYCGAKYAVAVSNGTAALILANKALGIQSGDHVITTPNTFVATANSIALNNGIPHLVDIDPDDLNISVDQVKTALGSGQKYAGIIPVHFAGAQVDMETIQVLAKEYGLYVIEDACHALGGKWIDKTGLVRRVGDCSHSDLTVFSFHPVKQITTGEGGMITTNDRKLYTSLLSLRTHGIAKPQETAISLAQPWLYEMNTLSANYRITDFQSALGLSQLAKSDHWIQRRSYLVARYDKYLKDISFLKPQKHTAAGESSYHLYIIQAQDRDALYHYLHEHDILVQVHYIPVHFHPYYQEEYGFSEGDYPVCEEYFSKALSLPLFPGLSDDEQDHVVETIRDFYDQY
ncbi:MAG: UDP-4-amino-4,6-dideoxy-N-acetyl-beta-L-altrosamine transaminase [Candidatus Marinimicrobia bacterium]|nr:UDP-4-amino-4,6-dideoxy-N-acetyl-beta-L-altrosamine transaminase [Candidatus Neomarinimicrobiota bacterium]